MRNSLPVDTLVGTTDSNRCGQTCLRHKSSMEDCRTSSAPGTVLTAASTKGLVRSANVGIASKDRARLVETMIAVFRSDGMRVTQHMCSAHHG